MRIGECGLLIASIAALVDTATDVRNEGFGGTDACRCFFGLIVRMNLFQVTFLPFLCLDT